jgi:ABC-type phosphate/phosphonate transport system substrate-binding protein
VAVTRFLLAAIAAGLLVPAAGRAEDKDVYRIGIPRSAFGDLPPALVAFASQPFKDLMKSQTGLNGEVVTDPDALNIAQSLDAGKLQLGVFLGHEFAWAREKYPDLVPLVCSVPRPREVQAFLLVRWDCKAAHLGNLRGAKLALATGTRDHARLFLERRKVAEMGGGSFASTAKAATVHDAIHDVIDGEADVTVADQASWSYFQKLYPGASQNLRVLSRSEVFPPTVIAYKKGALAADAIKRLREGLLTAHKTSKGSKLMDAIKVERFDDVPASYDDALMACLKAYPGPIAEK